MFHEQRKFKRFTSEQWAFAAFIRLNELINMGQIENIGMGGLCVRYLPANEDNKGCSAIKIFGGNGRFLHLDRLQCRIAYDHEVPKGPWEQTRTRRYGVEFENLSVEQLSVLQNFIDYFGFR
jgi:hypothetical protein